MRRSYPNLDPEPRARSARLSHLCVSYIVDKYSGPGFLCLGDAHRFIDPIFSFGLYLTLKEGQLATPHILRYLNGETRNSPDPFAEHEAMCSGALDVLQDLIDAFWEEPISFATLVSHPRTRPDMIDMFAGRVYMPAPSEGATSLHKIALKARGLAVSHRATKFGVGSRGDVLSVTGDIPSGDTSTSGVMRAALSGAARRFFGRNARVPRSRATPGAVECSTLFAVSFSFHMGRRGAATDG